jgi:hypothetical protein
MRWFCRPWIRNWLRNASCDWPADGLNPSSSKQRLPRKLERVLQFSKLPSLPSTYRSLKRRK